MIAQPQGSSDCRAADTIPNSQDIRLDVSAQSYLEMNKKSLSKIAEDQPIRKHDIASGKLVLRQRASGGVLLPAEESVGMALKRKSSKR
ncbi:MAG: hypothetical protein ACKO1K_04300 [Burkholderiales bacterium]